MIALDTNVLVRFLVRDDEPQAQAARRVVEGLTVSDPGFVPVIVLCELWWVLRRAYGVERAVVVEQLRRLVDTPEIRVEQPTVVARALRRAVDGGDLADAMVAEAAAAAGCSTVMSFDRAAQAKLGFTSPT